MNQIKKGQQDWSGPQVFYLAASKLRVTQDIPYHVTLENGQITITQNKVDNKPQFILQCSFNLVISWKFVIKYSKETLVAFGIQNEGSLFWLHADETELYKFKDLLGRLVLHNNIHDFYNQGNTISRGHKTKVCLGVEKKTGTIFAAKVIKKEDISNQKKDYVKNELTALTSFSHPNVLKFKEAFDGSQMIYILTEYLGGYSLAEQMVQREFKFKINEFLVIAQQILGALSHIHQSGFVHRNLKPENVLFKNKDDFQSLRIIGFSSAIKKDDPSMDQQVTGTPGYIAPEIIKNYKTKVQYDGKCDVFAAGAILYKLMTGKDLFRGSCQQEILKSNKLCEIDLELLKLSQFPQSCRDLVTRMLEIEPEYRVSSTDALYNPIFLLQDSFLFQDVETSTALNLLSIDLYSGISEKMDERPLVQTPRTSINKMFLKQ